MLTGSRDPTEGFSGARRLTGSKVVLATNDSLEKKGMQQTEMSIPASPASQGCAAIARNTFSVVEHDSAARASLEARIRSGFGMHFDACVEGFMPRFAHYRHTSGATGVIGFRRASDEPLFLESYLDVPVESVIAEATGTFPARDRVAEVGQFVVDDRDIVACFFRDLVAFLIERNFDWVCFTGTDRIRALLARIGFHGLPIARAEETRVRRSPDRWGRYYDFDPIVVLGKLEDPQGRWFAGSCAIAKVSGP